MKAAVIDEQGRYALADREAPRPGPGEVAVRVVYAGVQWGDVLVADGVLPVPRPFVPGFEVAGEVAGLGPGVSGLRVGEPVLALTSGGGHAEVALAPADLAVGLGQVPPREAAGLGWAGPTAYDLVNTVGRVLPGDRVLVHGAAGSVGTLAAQFARAAGAARLTGVAGSTERAAYAEGFGFDAVVTRDAFPAALEGERFDVVLDPVGGRTREANRGLLAEHGRLAVYGAVAGGEEPVWNAADLLAQGQTVAAYNSVLLSRTHPQRLAGSLRHALQSVAAGTVRVDVTAEYDLADLGSAVHRLREGGVHGKAVVRVA